MVQTVGLVNVVVKSGVGYYDDAGTWILGDGSTADDVLPKTAANLAKNGSLVANSDVLMDLEDFKLYIKANDTINRG